MASKRRGLPPGRVLRFGPRAVTRRSVLGVTEPEPERVLTESDAERIRLDQAQVRLDEALSAIEAVEKNKEELASVWGVDFVNELILEAEEFAVERTEGFEELAESAS